MFCNEQSESTDIYWALWICEIVCNPRVTVMEFHEVLVKFKCESPLMGWGTGIFLHEFFLQIKAWHQRGAEAQTIVWYVNRCKPRAGTSLSLSPLSSSWPPAPCTWYDKCWQYLSNTYVMNICWMWVMNGCCTGQDKARETLEECQPKTVMTIWLLALG